VRPRNEPWIDYAFASLPGAQKIRNLYPFHEKTSAHLLHDLLSLSVQRAVYRCDLDASDSIGGYAGPHCSGSTVVVVVVQSLAGSVGLMVLHQRLSEPQAGDGRLHFSNTLF
jgi:hypothetical protein